MRFKEEQEGPIDPYSIIIDRTPREVTEVRRRISAVAVFLYTWNNELYTRPKRGVRCWRVAKEVQRTLLDVELSGLVVALEDKEIDSNLEVISKQIMDAHRLLSAKKLIKNTGASKVLHLLNPKLFVIWDNDIRQHYLSSHTGHPIGSPECYFHFLR